MMDVAGIQSGLVGFALFDSWMDSMRKLNKCHRAIGSPLVAAAADAFESYLDATELQIGAQISALAPFALTPKSDLTTYALNPGGASTALINPITPQQIAPFLALNVLA
jgi:hypothetical protein